MPTRDAINRNRIVNALTQATLTTSTDGVTVDLLGFDAAGFFVFAGPSGDTLSGTVEFELDIAESDDGATWNYAGDWAVITLPTASVGHTGIGVANGAANSGAFYLATSSTPLALVGGQQPVFAGSYIGTKRYIRLHVQMTGTHASGIPVSAVCLLARPNYIPTTGNLS